MVFKVLCSDCYSVLEMHPEYSGWGPTMVSVLRMRKQLSVLLVFVQCPVSQPWREAGRWWVFVASLMGYIWEYSGTGPVRTLSCFCSLSSGWWRDLLWSRWHHHKHRDDRWRLVEGCLQRPIRVVPSELCGAETIETVVCWLCLNSPVNKSDLIHYKSWCFSENGGVYTYCFYI